MFEHMGRRRGKEEKVAQATMLSVALHGALLFLLAWGVRESSYLLANEQAGTGPGTGPAGGGGGGGSGEQVSYFEVPAAPAPPVVVEPTPEDVIPPPEVPPPPQEAQPETPRETAAPQPAAPAPTGGAGTGTGGGQGPGAGPGTGPGSGGGTGGGSGGGIGSGTGPGTGGGTGSIIPPSTDLLLLPPDKPRGVPSQVVVVRFHVNKRGRVTRVELLNPTGNRRYDDELRRRMAEYEFSPGRDARTGEAVDAATDIEITI